MNMAESRPRPTPKPRPRQKSPPGNTVSSTNVSPNISRSAPEGKPPITRPKPVGYKQLDFNNKFLVGITADIDIGDGSEQNNSDANENFEKNNNVANLKHGNNKVLTRNGLNEKVNGSVFFMFCFLYRPLNQLPFSISRYRVKTSNPLVENIENPYHLYRVKTRQLWMMKSPQVPWKTN